MQLAPPPSALNKNYRRLAKQQKIFNFFKRKILYIKSLLVGRRALKTIFSLKKIEDFL
jgi:hypothetical protein